MAARPFTLSPEARHFLLGGALVVAAAIGFSSKAILVKLAYEMAPGLDPIALMALRMSFALPFFIAIALWTNTITPPADFNRRDALTVAAVGTLGYYLASLLDFAGLQYIPATTERLILMLYPSLVLLLSALFLGHQVGRRERLAVVVSYLGIALVFSSAADAGSGPVPATGPPGPFSATAFGSALVFASAVSFALFMMGSGVLIRRLGAVRFTTWSMSLSSAITLVHFGASSQTELGGLPLAVFGLALVMALVSTVLPAFMMNAGIARIGAGRASIISGGGPVITLALGWVLLGETMAPLQLCGAALVLVGIRAVGKVK